MISVGVVGLGMMGTTHLAVYANRPDAHIAAVSDRDRDRLFGKSSVNVNINGLPGGSVVSDDIAKYENADDLIADSNVTMVDICLPTPLHAEYALKALDAGKHVLVEKPLGRTASEAFSMAEASDDAAGLAMPAMCMRFWPGWDWLKQTIRDRTYGRVLSAHFKRLTSHPGGAFYSNGEACGGALLDLHVHDTDFVNYCFGPPEAVYARGYSSISGEIDHVFTQYIYSDVPLVTAEGGWAMSDGFGLEMQYTVNFEHATTRFSFNGTNNLTLIEQGKKPRKVDIASEMGFLYEIVYFLECISNNFTPHIVNFRDAAHSIAIVEAERRSIAYGKIVEIG
jgi:predicted dehydrogenase